MLLAAGSRLLARTAAPVDPVLAWLIDGQVPTEVKTVWLVAPDPEVGDGTRRPFLRLAGVANWRLLARNLSDRYQQHIDDRQHWKESPRGQETAIHHSQGLPPGSRQSQ